MRVLTLAVAAAMQLSSWGGAEAHTTIWPRQSIAGAPAGWTYDVKRQGGRIAAIRWRMDIKPGEFAEFAFVARNPQNTNRLVWTLREFFADGKVTDFTNGPDGLYPNAVVKLTPSGE